MIQIILIDSYFDGTDYNDTIKYYVNDKFYYFIDPVLIKQTDLYIKENNAILFDNVVTNMFGNGNNVSFFQVSSYREGSKRITVDNTLLRILIMYDAQFDIYTRQ